MAAISSDLVVLLLNVLLAAFVMAFSLAFVTATRARRSLRRIRASLDRWRWGLAVELVGLVLLLPALVPGLLGSRMRFTLFTVTYPLLFSGIALAASATWPERGDRSAEGRASREVS